MVVRFPKAPTATNSEPHIDVPYQVGRGLGLGSVRRASLCVPRGLPAACASLLNTLWIATDAPSPAPQGQELHQLELAYAITVHKAQGGEARHVVLALSQQHGRMLTRRLLYTGEQGRQWSRCASSGCAMRIKPSCCTF